MTDKVPYARFFPMPLLFLDWKATFFKKFGVFIDFRSFFVFSWDYVCSIFTGAAAVFFSKVFFMCVESSVPINWCLVFSR
jgi:hypothetical protein